MDVIYLSSPFPFSNHKLVFYVCGFSDHFKPEDLRSKITFICHSLFSFNLVSQPIFMILILTFKKYLILVALGLHCLCGLSLVTANRAYSSVWYLGFSLWWLLLLLSTGARACRLP